jgi:hypothetical protein
LIGNKYIEETDIKIDWDTMGLALNALADVIEEGLNLKAHGGKIRPYVKMGRFAIGVPIKQTNPPFPELAFKAAEEAGLGVAKDKSGVLIEIRGKNWKKMIEVVRKKYLLWISLFDKMKTKVMRKVTIQPTP